MKVKDIVDILKCSAQQYMKKSETAWQRYDEAACKP